MCLSCDFQMLNIQTDKSSRLIFYPATWLIFLLPCFCFFISPSLSPSFSLLPFALMMQLIKLREEVSASLLWQFKFCFPTEISICPPLSRRKLKSANLDTFLHVWLNSLKAKSKIMNSLKASFSSFPSLKYKKVKIRYYFWYAFLKTNIGKWS